MIRGKKAELPYGIPLFSVMIDSGFYNSYCGKPEFRGDTVDFLLADSIKGRMIPDLACSKGLKFLVRFTNQGKGIHSIENLVPMGEGTDKIYITAGGTKDWPQYLCRSLLFRPGYVPFGIILPDNAWHLGFADFRLNDTLSVTALARKTSRNKELCDIDRWASKLKPGGWVEYSLWFDSHSGDWQAGLDLMFRQRFLYDLDKFDNSFFLRTDLQWMKSRYLMLLQFAWDDKYYDYKAGTHTYYKSLFEYDKLTGGYDIFTLWPTWPRLGLDQRNQWDMYRDLPGGLAELKKQSQFAHDHGKKYFISYNPWDEGTRKEDQMNGMETLLRATDADGVVLDTRGSSSLELQAAADRVKPGIIMYSEGMAVPKDMPGIVSGRVHDALVLPPALNMNKFIKPDFAIFRVLQLADDRIQREISCALFNGYGVEINSMRPGRPAWMKDEYTYLGRALRILRENDAVFHNCRWLPLVPTLTDSVYVNRWQSDSKTLYTVYSIRTQGYEGSLIEIAKPPDSMHYVDLWNHLEIQPGIKGKKYQISIPLESFSKKFLGTRREGSVGCFALLPRLLNVTIDKDVVTFSASKGDRILLWEDFPSYSVQPAVYPVTSSSARLKKDSGKTSGIALLQLFAGNELVDEFIIRSGYPEKYDRGEGHLASTGQDQSVPVRATFLSRTRKTAVQPEGMCRIPGAEFRFYTKRDEKAAEAFIPFPDRHDTVKTAVKAFYMDRYPVTNRDYSRFILASGYQPEDTSCYLRQWGGLKTPTDSILGKPVVFVSPEDAEKYCRHYGKRLPTEEEWQYAAQGDNMRTWPWGNAFDSTLCNAGLNHTTDVTAHPGGASPFGVQDMIGNVWQFTGDSYYNGAYYYRIIRGGSYYHPTQSIWYVTGGPVPAWHPEMLLLIAPGLDRNATIGFRCVKDSD